MEENIKVDWVNWLMLISGLIFLAIVGWYGMVLIKSHVFLRSHMDLVNSSLADASTILHEYKSSDAGTVMTASPGVFLGRVGCLLVWRTRGCRHLGEGFEYCQNQEDRGDSSGIVGQTQEQLVAKEKSCDPNHGEGWQSFWLWD